MDNPTKSDTITSDTSVKEVKKIILQLEAIVEESHDAIIGKTLDGTIVTWNGGATRLFGYTREEMIGRSIADLFSPGNRNELPVLLERIKKGETIADYDSIWIKKDGTNADVEFSVSPIHGEEKGLIIGSSLIGRDVTDRKRKETEIQSMANFPMENPYPVFRMSEAGKILFANKASEIFSLSAGSVAPDFWVNLVKDVSQKKEIIENVEFGVNKRMFSLDIVPILDKNYVNVYGREITLRKKAEQELLKLKLAVEGSSEAIFTTNKEGIITYVNPEFTKLFGYTSDEVVNKVTPRILKSGLTKEEEYKKQWATLLAKETVKGEIVDKTKDGRFVTVERANTAILNKKGEIIGFLAIYKDLTERKLMEETIRGATMKIEKIEKSKTEFIGIAAHQLRSPITTIEGNASILLDGANKGAFTEEQKVSIEDIEKSAKNMGELVNFLLKITRVESGKMKLDLSPINLREIIETTIEVLSSELDPKNQTVEISQEPDPFPYVFLDKEIVKQVILNLVSNANRYSPKNSIIKVSMNLKGSDIELSVKNSGIGIPKEQQSKIFEKFFRADNARAVVSEGTGLGLALVKSFVEAWGGKIWFESEENEGATFYVTMPIIGKIEASKDMVL